MKSGDCLDTSAIFPLKKDSMLLGLYLTDGPHHRPRSNLTFFYLDDIHVLRLGGKNACHKASGRD